jgi:phosphatidylinositol alpha 1,6-mannosyltransferase
MRVALFSGNYNYVRDGANQALNRLVGYLENSAGAQVRVYSPTSPTPAFAPTGTLVSVPSFAIPGRGEYRFATGLTAALRKDIAAFKPDLFHLSAPDFLGNQAKSFARQLGVPVVTSLHTRFETYLAHYGLNWLKARTERYLRNFYNSSDFVLAPTPAIVEELAKQGLGSRVRLWGRGVDPAAFHPSFRSNAWRRAQNIADDDIALLFFGRLVREKGLSLFADLVHRLGGEGIAVKPLLVGDGPARAWVEAQMPGAHLTGHLMGKDLGCAVASADIFVNPSTTEAFGNVTLEAMASGVAPICADVQSASSLISPGLTGMLCPATDVDAYAANVRHLIETPGARTAIGHAAFEASKSRTWDSTLEMVVETYRTALAR